MKDQPDVLHFRIEAPLEDRIQRIKQQTKQSLEEYFEVLELRRKAKDLIAQQDTASQDYLQRFYNVDWSDPLLYHMVLNTGKSSIEYAAQIIAGLVNDRQSEQRLDEQSLSSA